MACTCGHSSLDHYRVNAFHVPGHCLKCCCRQNELASPGAVPADYYGLTAAQIARVIQ